MHRDELLKQLAPWREKHVRLTWKPIVSESDGAPAASKFSGTPWLAAGEDWPTCIGCKHPLQLFLQLNLSELPQELGNRFGTGLLQLFYCVNYDCDASSESWQPFGGPTIVRVIQPVGPERNDITVPVDQFPPRTMVGWNVEADFPSLEECEGLGLNCDYDFKANRATISWRDAGLQFTDIDFETADSFSIAQPGDKLAGWPSWVQCIEYPHCPQCGKQMELIFQLDSEDNLPYMFGDVGCGHITQCPTHKEVVTFGWACA